MTILFIRHAAAVGADEWKGPDIDRPLTKEGIRIFRRIARRLADWYPRPDRLVCSRAARARGTAELLHEQWKRTPIETRAELNPGARLPIIRNLLRETASVGLIVLVGHEPDFSQALAGWVTDGTLRLKLKKGGVAEVRWTPGGKAELRALLSPGHCG